MFSPKSPYTQRTPLSGSKLHKFYNASRRGGSFLTPTCKRPFTPGSRDLRNQSLNRSYQTTVLEETAQHSVVYYGNPLPVLVTEAITSAERITDISMRLEDSGWASLVCGRRLFIWKYKPDAGSKSFIIHCRELTLPPSDLAHKAELVQVFTTPESQMPSALAVSPEGIVRYWPNIIHEGSSVEAATDLQGQECYSLTSMHPLGFILATTTSSLVIITPSVADGQHNVICRTLKVPQGVLAGIGRRVSSFIFGALPAQATEAKQLNKVLSAEGAENDERVVYVLSSTLQKWQLSHNEPDKLLYEHDLDRCLKENFMQSLWAGNSPTQLHQIRTWCLDMQLTQNGVVILCAAMNPNHSRTVSYAIATVNGTDALPAADITSFIMIKHSEKYQIENEEKLLSFRFLLPSKNSQIAYVYSGYEVLCVSISDPGADHDLIDVSSWGDILGAGTCENTPLFFTQFQSLLALYPNQQSLMDASSHLMTPQKDLIKEHSAAEPSAENLPSQLRSAMCLYYNNDVEKCQEMISEMFPQSSALKTSFNLDTTVVTLSTQIIDDFPVSDPRWCESVPSGDSVSSSLIILHQLDDKLKVHKYLIDFLKFLGLFERLSTVKIQDTKALTKLVLCEHAEKLVAAKAIRRFLIDYNELLDTAIRAALADRKVEPKSHLTHQDMFFREVSAVHTIFHFVLDLEEKSLADDDEDVISIISTVNRIFVGVISDVLQYRQSKVSAYGLSEGNNETQFLPWTSSEGAMGLRTILLQQHSLNMQYMLKATDDLQVQGAVFQQLVDITDFLLDGYAAELESVKDTDQFATTEVKYVKERNRLIQPLLDVGQFARAASLAEKYFDFDILMQLCEETDDKDRLQQYNLQFKGEGFSDFMFKWYLDKGMRNKLLIHPLGQQEEELSRFLQGHGDLSWLHHINNNKFGLAQQTLGELATKETTYLSKKKTLVSLSKLAALASEFPTDVKNNQIEALNLEQDLIAHQENLPDCLVEACGLDPDTMRVLSPEELIEMYVSDENTSATSYDFKIALELLQFIKKPPGDSDYENLRFHIWCKAILRDSWDDLDTNNPLDAMKSTTFFQVIELAFDQGVDLHDFVVSVDDLLQSPELGSLAENPSFAFLLRAGYEHILKLIE